MRDVQFHLIELMDENHIRSISELSVKTGVSRPTLTKLYYNKNNTRVDFTTCSTLCHFFNCKLSDLVTLQGDAEAVC